MKFRIAIWAFAGFLVAAFWAIYAFAAGPIAMISQPMIWAFARFTCPIVLAGDHFNFGISLYWAFVSNAAAYALMGLIVELMRRTFRPIEFQNK